jgi:hypothetical protein
MTQHHLDTHDPSRDKNRTRSQPPLQIVGPANAAKRSNGGNSYPCAKRSTPVSAFIDTSILKRSEDEDIKKEAEETRQVTIMPPKLCTEISVKLIKIIHAHGGQHVSRGPCIFTPRSGESCALLAQKVLAYFNQDI